MLLQGRLVIAVTRAGDSGNYSCLPSYATPDWVMVHIVTGNYMGNCFKDLAPPVSNGFAAITVTHVFRPV